MNLRDKFVETRTFVHEWSNGDKSYCIPAEWFQYYFQNWNVDDIRYYLEEERCDYISINGTEYFGFHTEEDYFMWHIKLL